MIPMKLFRARSNNGKKRHRNDGAAETVECNVDPNARASACKYIQNGRWQLFRNLLLSIEASGSPHDLADVDEETQRTILHEMCLTGNNPPVDVVRTLLRLFPSMAVSKDKDGNIPLHCAVTSGSACSTNVVRALLKANNNNKSASTDVNVNGELPPAEIRDAGGNTALMLACQRLGSPSDTADRERADEVVDLLLAAESLPSSRSLLLLENDEGRTALEMILTGEDTPDGDLVARMLQMIRKVREEERQQRMREEQQQQRTGNNKMGRAVKRLSHEMSRRMSGGGGSRRRLFVNTTPSQARIVASRA